MDIRDENGTKLTLPPLPTPNHKTRTSQARMGCALVIYIIIMVQAAVHVGTMWMHDWLSGALVWTCRVLGYMLALVASRCLAGLMWGDPGIIHRSQDTCMPVPEEIAQKLRAMQDMGEVILSDIDTANIKNGSWTYCTRCYVWRKPQDGKKSVVECCPGAMSHFHHCRICQRCVANFDHHCGVFGRCIAGRGFGGNMGYFKIIIFTGYAGGLLGAVTFVAGLSQSGTAAYWIALGLSVYAGICALLGLAGATFAIAQRMRRSWSLKGAGWSRVSVETSSGDNKDGVPSATPAVIGNAST